MEKKGAGNSIIIGGIVGKCFRKIEVMFTIIIQRQSQFHKVVIVKSVTIFTITSNHNHIYSRGVRC